MGCYDKWRYYTYGGLEPGDYTTYLRYRRGRAEVFSPKRGIWIETDGKSISRYIENGEINLTETTRREMEAAVGVPLPT